jgi:CRISPR-associated protein Csb1
VNHSNVAPTIDEFAGGITFDYAVQTTVLSLPALRRLRFATGLDGKPIANRDEVEALARTALAALGVAGIVHHRARGYDLRSRCLLIPDGALALEVVYTDGKTATRTLDVEAANALVKTADAQLNKLGLGWKREPMRLKPAPKLVALIKKSRAEEAAGGVER